MNALVVDLLQRTRVALGWWLLGVLAMAVYVVAIFETIGGLKDLADLYASYPESFRKLFGDVDITTINGWMQVEFLSYLPLVLAIYAGIFAAGTISREAEQRTVDFLLGLPVARWEFISSRLLVGAINIGIVCVAVFVVLIGGVALIGQSPPAERVALSLLNAYLLAVALLAAYVAVAAMVDEQSRVTGITLGLTLVLYIATAALKASDAPDAVRWLMPFEHYHSAQAMSGDGLPPGALVVLAMAGIVAGSFAIYWYNRRDIAT